ncbi:uncharacterized protein SOCEGT47_048030 [Sorangium cellulosum]|uniref:Lysozyme n=1 Tax=Sorangium cellulosum TaxID=56 RepID=A0A4P2Q5C4_SORCE|nr:glycoside hydrolase family 25 protein [Sorangium cellulosum]AUX24266.1 uncharacterized protein SOCEGT47_048030 [Sorangium cellulosum]
MLSGADVSVHQGHIQWDAFAPQLDFVFIRATYGPAAVDRKLAYNRAEAARRGLIRGYYHYALPGLDPLEQAQKVCSVVGALEPGELDLVLDLEETQHERDEGHRWTQDDTLALQEWTRRFVGEVKARYPGRSVILYTRHNFWHQYLGGSAELVDCPLWIANYTYGSDPVTARPPANPKAWAAWAQKKPLKAWDPWAAWSFWQISARAVMPGVTANTVDANLFNGTRGDLLRLARLEAGPPAKGPQPTADALCLEPPSQADDPYVVGPEVRLTDPGPSAEGAAAFFAAADVSTRTAAPVAHAEITPALDGTGLEALPPRAPDAMTGTQFHERARGLSLSAREELFVDEVLRGNVPSFLRRFHHVTVEAPDGKQGVVSVCADYLAVGSDIDFLRMPLTGVTAQRVADACGCVLPTKKLVKDIYAASRKQTAIPFPPEDGTRMATMERFLEHHLAIEQRRVGELGELLAGHKKDVVVTNRLRHHPRRLAIYGFHRADGEPWQPLDTSLDRRLPHEDTYVDYSHGARLIGGLMALGPEPRRVLDVLLDPALCDLLSDEGVLGAPRYEVRAFG